MTSHKISKQSVKSFDDLIFVTYETKKIGKSFTSRTILLPKELADLITEK